jgi:transketolase C-terminal domain/subunit
MRSAYGNALVELGRARKDVVVLSADVSSSDFSYMFEQSFPDRFFNVGIAEPALVDAAVGLANGGFVPIANTFAFLFATRALEMVRTHLCFGKANVKLAGAYAGLSDSFDGPTHHSITDLAILRSLPGMTVVVPADPLAVTRLLPQVAAWDGPVFFRLCRNEVPQIFTADYQPEIGKGITLVEGDDATIIACSKIFTRGSLKSTPSSPSMLTWSRVARKRPAPSSPRKNTASSVVLAAPSRNAWLLLTLLHWSESDLPIHLRNVVRMQICWTSMA